MKFTRPVLRGMAAAGLLAGAAVLLSGCFHTPGAIGHPMTQRSTAYGPVIGADDRAIGGAAL
ncbi:MAG: hypothetical protein EOO54_21740, partial [Haliea sp.]